MDYLNKYDIEDILTKGGIIPSTKEYALTDVENVLTKGIGYRCIVGCSDYKYIDAFQICEDWNGKGIDCPDTLTSNCDSQVILSDGS